jgi:hypothetical protein
MRKFILSFIAVLALHLVGGSSAQAQCVQKLGRAGSSGILGENMTNCGNPKPVRTTATAAHHITAQEAKRATIARNLVLAAGIDINDAVNGVWLAANTANACAPECIHSKIHTNTYYRGVDARITTAAGGEHFDSCF